MPLLTDVMLEVAASVVSGNLANRDTPASAIMDRWGFKSQISVIEALGDICKQYCVKIRKGKGYEVALAFRAAKQSLKIRRLPEEIIEHIASELEDDTNSEKNL